jgi:isochorismate pyruvate lyase
MPGKGRNRLTRRDLFRISIALAWETDAMAAEAGKSGSKPTEEDWSEGIKSLADVRANIDRLDAQIVPLLCERHRYVTAAARFKPSVDGVVVPGRVEEIIHRVRDMSAARGVNPDTMETVYRALIDAFTRDEQARWRDTHQ